MAKVNRPGGLTIPIAYITRMAPVEEKTAANDIDAMLTIREASERLRLSRSLIYALCARGILNHYRCGLGRGTIRISEKALSAYLERSRMTGRIRREGGMRKTIGFKHLNSGKMVSAWKEHGAL